MIVYTDGSCLTRPNEGYGPGGWAWISVGKEFELHACGGDDHTTNNRMELQAVIDALQTHSDTTTFTMYSDSKYVINCAQGKWRRKKNKDLWDEYDKAAKGKTLTWVGLKATAERVQRTN